MKFLPLPLLCVTLCYCLYYEDAGQNKVYPQQGVDSQSKGYPQQNDQQIVQIPTRPPYWGKCKGPPVALGGVKCKASMKRYFYDENKGRCVKFTYGGCGATRNNFETMKECRETCMKRRPTTPNYNYPNYPKYPITPNYYYSN
ncbi:Kunitz/Bovine pancreatic trypsin inhibitor domain protein [Ancylostoma duodenale]|uniref:Kunitz/Bovine pancreatic trypsin inhibitor domain protein n=1 Tax=Ancylostoma duodenale TaxID=51022 RepID=A0A0C2C953_9BILA|nr:Kunitz/Bovine pancreatic trypsin inhibitor domain protein [Ancylostoma duodenale]